MVSLRASLLLAHARKMRALKYQGGLRSALVQSSMARVHAAVLISKGV